MNWIKCSDRLPEYGDVVLAYGKKLLDDSGNDLFFDICYMVTNNVWVNPVLQIRRESPQIIVTHWAPIELPEGLE